MFYQLEGETCAKQEISNPRQVSDIKHQNFYGVNKTKPDKFSPLKEARQIAMVGDSREKVRHSKRTIRKSKSMSAFSRNLINSSLDIAKPLSDKNRS